MCVLGWGGGVCILCDNMTTLPSYPHPFSLLSLHILSLTLSSIPLQVP